MDAISVEAAVEASEKMAAEDPEKFVARVHEAKIGTQFVKMVWLSHGPHAALTAVMVGLLYAAEQMTSSKENRDKLLKDTIEFLLASPSHQEFNDYADNNPGAVERVRRAAAGTEKPVPESGG